MPDFLYTGISALTGCAEDSECASYCDSALKCVPKCFNGECSCINCEIKCEWGGKKTKNFSPQPLIGTGEWTCGKQIPIGEVIERSAFLGAKMLAEFQGIIDNGEKMIEKTDEILDDYKNWNCEKDCETKCHKYYHITKGECEPDEDWRCPDEVAISKGVSAVKECQECISSNDCDEKCDTCEECKEICCWQQSFCWDLEENKIITCPTKDEEIEFEIINCKYCRQLGSCEEKCNAYSCSGCCNEYFDPIIKAYSALENLPELLKNDIEEKTPGGEEIPKESKFKYKRSYILDQLEFSRCELAQCHIKAKDWYNCLEGKIVCPYLFMAKTASQLGFFDDDQFISLVAQIINDEKTTKEIWGELWETPEHWWEIPLIPFVFFGKIITLSWTVMWDMLEESFATGKEDACYPFNYYCCEL